MLELVRLADMLDDVPDALRLALPLLLVALPLVLEDPVRVVSAAPLVVEAEAEDDPEAEEAVEDRAEEMVLVLSSANWPE